MKDWAKVAQRELKQQTKVSLVCGDGETMPPAIIEGGEPASAAINPHKKKDLSRILADPTMPESKWMAACIIADNQCLVPKESHGSRFFSALNAGAGMLCSLFTLMLSFVVALFLSGNIAWLTTGADLNDFMRALGDGLGLLVCIFGTLSFWTSLLFRNRLARRCVGLASTAVVGVCALGFMQVVSTLAAVIFTLLCIGMVIGLGLVGAELKENLPRSFSAKRLAGSLTLALSLPAITMFFLLWTAATAPSSDSPYAPADLSGLSFNFGVLAFCTFVPGLAIALCSRTKSLAACATLSTALQMPIVAGLFAAGAATLAAGGFGPAALARFGFLAGTMAITLALSMTGGLTGAWLNTRQAFLAVAITVRTSGS